MSDVHLWSFPDPRTAALNDRDQQQEYANAVISAQMRSQANYSGYTVGQDTAFRRWSEACVRAALAVGGAFEMRYDPLRHEVKATLRRAWVALEDEALAALAPLAMLSQRIECVCEDGDCCVSVLFSFSRFSEQ